MDIVQSKKPQIQPNPGFKDQLLKYEVKLSLRNNNNNNAINNRKSINNRKTINTSSSTLENDNIVENNNSGTDESFNNGEEQKRIGFVFYSITAFLMMANHGVIKNARLIKGNFELFNSNNNSGSDRNNSYSRYNNNNGISSNNSNNNSKNGCNSNNSSNNNSNSDSDGNNINNNNNNNKVADDFRPVIRDNFDMKTKIKDGSEPIKRNYGRRSEE
ncbi:hypothetical protein ACTA71_008348 [Dictyostelium dimigraforme]